MEEPPSISAPAPETVDETESVADLPTMTKPDGTLVIDLKPLAPEPTTCVEENPDPFNPTILVCSRTEPDPRFGEPLGPVDEILFASAIPRAKVKLSENAEAQANTIKKPVGNFDADGAELRVKIEF
ncbi:MAG: hypothetical protein AAF251_08850 [Pseudomonadota bacterium]